MPTVSIRGSLIITWALRLGNGGEEGHEPGAAEELGDEHGGVALRLGGLDPLQARPQHALLAAPLPEHTAPVAAHRRRPRPPTTPTASHTTKQLSSSSTKQVLVELRLRRPRKRVYRRRGLESGDRTLTRGSGEVTRGDVG
jgi:hypothetical protein